MRRGRDDDYGPGNSLNQGDDANEPGKYARKSNSSKFKPVHHSKLPSMENLRPFKNWSFEKECNLSSLCQNPAPDRPFRGPMPWNGDPFSESALPELSFTGKHGETVPRPSSSSVSKIYSFEPSNMESGALGRDLYSNSKLVGTNRTMTEATSSHGEAAISPVLSAQGSVGTGEKSESKVPSLGSEKVDFQEEKCTKSKDACVDDRDTEFLDDDSNYEKKKKKNCDSIRNETENESLAEKNLETSHYSDHTDKKIGDKTRSANEYKYVITLLLPLPLLLINPFPW